MSKKILREYQKAARDFILGTLIGGCLFMEMRLGKTLLALRIVLRLLWGTPSGKILIVGPNSTHKGWLEALAEEGHTAVLVKGTPKQKEKLLTGPGTFFLLNKEGHNKGTRVVDLKKGDKLGINRKALLKANRLYKAGDKAGYKDHEKESADHLESLGLKKFPMRTIWKPLDGLIKTDWLSVILDESHFIKNPNSGVSKFYVKNFRHVAFKLCLTGTPYEKNELDFVQQYLFVLGDGAPFDYWHFRAAFTKQVNFDYYIGAKGRAVLNKIAEMVAFSLRRKDVGMDKEKIFEVRTVELPSAARKIYTQLELEFVLEYKEQRKVTKYIIERFSAMRRICGGFVPLPKDEDGRKQLPDLIHQAKVKELFNILDENFRDEPVVIFAHFTAELDLINKYLTAKGFKCGQIDGRVKIGKARWRIEKDFKRGKFNKLIVQPGTVKEGVDLSTASTSIYYSLPAGYITWKQTQDRILDLMKEGSLLLIILEVEGTIETNMWEKLESNTTKEDIILSILHDNNKKFKKIKEKGGQR